MVFCLHGLGALHGELNNRFDGIDWDWEGNDDLESSMNTLPIPCLDMMGMMSVGLKKRGYVVSMAPAESYFDSSTRSFDVDLRHEYPEYTNGFKYHGLNPYAYLYQRYKYYEGNLLTFDWVMIQIYERFSHALHNVSISKQNIGDYFSNLYQRYTSNQWVVDIPLKNNRIKVESQQLVIGLANAWANNENGFFYIHPTDLDAVYQSPLHQYRGFGVWDLKDEGINGVDYTKHLSNVLSLKKTFLTHTFHENILTVQDL